MQIDLTGASVGVVRGISERFAPEKAKWRGGFPMNIFQCLIGRPKKA